MPTRTCADQPSSAAPNRDQMPHKPFSRRCKQIQIREGNLAMDVALPDQMVQASQLEFAQSLSETI